MRIVLNRDVHIGYCVMQCTVTGIVFAYGAVKLMTIEQPIHALLLRGFQRPAFTPDRQTLFTTKRAAAHPLAIRIYPTDITAL
ncbi:hypothetical protein ACJ2_24850 [Pantoea sp. QMID2]|nr:hypothetical protein ACJ3_28440 [Pantoea sp. QMID3]GME58176.1 hypothetical protein ACJ2_24850 [Pantoea sp. QMID2]